MRVKSLTPNPRPFPDYKGREQHSGASPSQDELNYMPAREQDSGASPAL